ncbi:MAG TPA: retropepsin-like aspartic protease [Polyangiaceae bacterium]
MRLAPIAVLVLAACASAPPPAKKPVAEEAFVLDSKDDAFDDSSAASDGKDGKATTISYAPGRTRAPIVHGSVRGKATSMLVDTGASRNFVADWLAHKIFETENGSAASDHAGRRISITQMDQPRLKIDGLGSLPDDSAMLLHDASSSEQSGIGVTMSPQSLGKAGLVLIDFPHKRLAIVRSHDEVERAMPKGPALAPATYCRGIYIMNAKIGDAPARLMLDTGAYATDLHPRSQPAKALTFHSSDGQGASMGAAGAISYHRLPGLAVTSGAVHVTIDVMLLDEVNEDPYCPFDGVLGMDVLQNCALVVDDKSITGHCN